MERRYLSLASAPVSLESRVGTDPPAIVGFAACYYRADDPGTEYLLWEYDDERCVERLMPGCFDAVAGKDAYDTVALFNHDANMLLGRVSAGTLALTRDGKGLKYNIAPPDAPIAQGVIQSIKRGDLKGSSFSFACKSEGQRFIRQGKQSVREIHRIDMLYDVGPVTFPAYGATTTGTRGAGARDEAKEAFKEWLAAEARRLGRATEATVRARCAQLGL